MSKDDVYDSIKKLKTLISEKDRDSECYNVYVSLIVELCDINRQKLANIEGITKKSYKMMSLYQRDNINRVAQKLVTINEMEKKVKSLE